MKSLVNACAVQNDLYLLYRTRKDEDEFIRKMVDKLMYGCSDVLIIIASYSGSEAKRVTAVQIRTLYCRNAVGDFCTL